MISKTQVQITKDGLEQYHDDHDRQKELYGFLTEHNVHRLACDISWSLLLPLKLPRHHHLLIFLQLYKGFIMLKVHS